MKLSRNSVLALYAVIMSVFLYVGIRLDRAANPGKYGEISDPVVAAWDADIRKKSVYGGFLIMIAATIYSSLAGSRRGGKLRELAAQIGFSYSDSLPPGAKAEFEALELLGFPASAMYILKVYDVVGGSLNSVRFLSFEYEYYRAIKGRNRDSHTVVAFMADGKFFPRFSLAPANMLDKVFPYADDRFPERPEFPKSCMVVGEEQPMKTLFSPEKIDFFIRNNDWSLAGCGNWLLVYKAGVHQPPDCYMQFLQDAKQVFDVISA
ncbi:MAG: hypothetical protein WCW52_01810 [Elusimicrobiales bacterium]|jgi:hypothetical protein